MTLIVILRACIVRSSCKEGTHMLPLVRRRRHRTCPLAPFRRQALLTLNGRKTQGTGIIFVGTMVGGPTGREGGLGRWPRSGLMTAIGTSADPARGPQEMCQTEPFTGSRASHAGRVPLED